MSGLLVYAPNWLGDSLMARPLVANLLDVFATRTAVVVAHPRVSPLWKAWPGLQVVETRTGPWLLDAVSTARRLRKLGPFKHGYILSASLRSATTMALAGVPERIGFAVGGRSWLLTKPVPRYPAGRLHYGREFLRLLPPGPSSGKVPDFDWPEQSQARARELLTGLGVADAPYAVMAVGSVGRAKRYPVEAWNRVIRLTTPHLPVILVGTAEEAPLARKASDGADRMAFDLCGATGLAELCVILAGAAAFAGADSGAAHLAAAVGCPSVVLFGPGDPVETTPVGEKVFVLRDGLWCSPCRSRECPRALSPSECMERIQPEQVVTALLAARRGHTA